MKRFFCVIFYLFLTLSLKSQDNHYSQFYANKLYLNPSFAGTDICPRVILGFRDQWPGLSGEFVSYTSSYDQSLNKVGIGLLFNADDAGGGVLKTNNVGLIVSPKIRLDENWTLSFAIEAGMIQKKLDHLSLVFPNQLDAKDGIVSNSQEISEDQSVIRSDFQSGVLLYSKQFYAGYAVHHILMPNISLIPNSMDSLYRRHTGHLGFNILLPASTKERRLGIGPKISPQIIYQSQGPARELNLGFYYIKDRLTTGLWYRNKDALAFLVGLQTKKLNFGFSYDITLSRLVNNSMGALEFSACYRFNCRPIKKSPQKMICPSF
jgi:type IX secretion system PorP/SprF family membrane protein